MKWLSIAALGLAACGVDKGKPDLSSDLATTFDAVTTTGGRWTEVSRIESDHPYSNDEARTFEVRGSPDATQLRISFDRFELEAGYDFVYVEGANEVLHRITGEHTGEDLVIDGGWARIRFETDYSVTSWGFSLSVYEQAACVCPEIYQPVCGTDDATYGNECEASCAGANVAYRGQCQAEAWIDVPRGVASMHPYPNDLDRTWSITEGGATSIRAHFSRIDVERGYDRIQVLDADGQVVASYTGQEEDVWTPAVRGDTLSVRLVSDYSVTAYGFEIDAYQVVGGCRVNADCRANEICQPVQCIRAPCFSVCEPARTGGYVEVTEAELARDPTSFDGQRVRVTAEPTVLPLCTRRGCTEADPCCNACSGSFTVASGVDLRDADDQPYGCRGNECSWASTCREFPAQDAGAYVFEGTVRAQPNVNRASLLIDTFRAATCQPAGCSGQVCANTPNVITTCEFRPEYACYRNADCEAQVTGHCGWTQTPELTQCLAGGAGTTSADAQDLPMDIPDDDEGGVVSRIDVRALGTIGQAFVTAEIGHSYRGDLIVTLISPAGTAVRLHDGDGGSADDLFIRDREIPELVGETRAGTWQLHVRDRYAQDTGAIEAFRLELR